jgi:hypothetical protein
MRKGGSIVIELWLDLGAILEFQKNNIIRYRLSVKKDEKLGICIDNEILNQYTNVGNKIEKFTKYKSVIKTKKLLGKNFQGNIFYRREHGRYTDVFVFYGNKSALANTPSDESRYPTGNAVKNFLLQGIKYIQLNSLAMRLPCPATRGTELELDGTNLARVVGQLLHTNRLLNGLFSDTHEIENPIQRWIGHLRYALPTLNSIEWGKREADNAEYLVLKYENGLECPTWLASDGTLRMLALTLPAFLPPTAGIYMVEEPENGVHPKALEIILGSLSTIPDAQTLVATHSPFVVQQVGMEPLLCFSMDTEGVKITPGGRHPALKEWDGTPDIGIVFAAGILE